MFVYAVCRRKGNKVLILIKFIIYLRYLNNTGQKNAESEVVNIKKIENYSL